LERAHRRLSQTHSLLGNHAAILRALRCDGTARRVLDIGCGHGGLLKKVRRQMGVEVLGVDLRPPEGDAGEFPILKLDAVREALPRADVAVSLCLVHHLRDEEFVELIRNVGRVCRRFVILDLVRHRVPLALFTAFAPLCLPRVNVLDGPVHPASVHAGGVSRLDRAGSVGDGREFSTQCGAPLDPPNG
jgi:SAM-dependent methyltransferase